MGRRKRPLGTSFAGLGFSEDRKRQVWEKGQIIRGKDRDLYRRDVAGNILYWYSYGKDTEMGWQVDHIIPIAEDGTDNLRNLQPLQTATNREKGDQHPWRP